MGRDLGAGRGLFKNYGPLMHRVLANRIWMGIVSASDQTQLHSF